MGAPPEDDPVIAIMTQLAVDPSLRIRFEASPIYTLAQHGIRVRPGVATEFGNQPFSKVRPTAPGQLLMR
jgi:hypothetical protein